MTLFFIFDLDGTLYSFKHTGIGKQMRVLINAFVADEFNLTPEEADAFSEASYRKYGLTARGLQLDQKVCQAVLRKYTGFVHQVDLTHIKYDPALVAALATLSKIPNSQCWIMTNAIKQHAFSCMAQMGITESFRDPATGQLRVVDCFDQWSHSSGGHEAICKPLVESYEYMLSVIGADPKKDKFVMVEDSMKNLEEPQKLGWKTVFITDEREEMEAPAKEHGHVVHTTVLDAVPDFLAWAKEAASETQ
jgi:pyrimidine 5'-nucleotidase